MRGPESRRPSRNTGQGVYGSGEAKRIILAAEGKPSTRSPLDEGSGVKVPRITAIRPETGRSNLGQGEISQQRDGGPKGY